MKSLAVELRWGHTSLPRLPWWLSGKASTCQCRRCKGCGFDPWVRKIPWSKKWQPTPVFLPGKFHGQRSLSGYSPWGHKELDPTEQLTLWLSLDKCGKVFEALSISLGTWWMLDIIVLVGINDCFVQSLGGMCSLWLSFPCILRALVSSVLCEQGHSSSVAASHSLHSQPWVSVLKNTSKGY